MSSQPPLSAVPDPGAVELTDEELMTRVQDQDEQAFAALYRRFAPGLFSMIYEILGEQKDSEDSLQETFVQMWKRSATYDTSRSRPFSWAVMIARHKAIDRLRAGQRRHHGVEVIAGEMAHQPVADQATSATEATLGDERKRVAKALSALPGEQSEALKLAFFSGLSHQEVSDKLGAPLGTVKARIRRGLLTLKSTLRRHD